MNLSALKFNQKRAAFKMEESIAICKTNKTNFQASS